MPTKEEAEQMAEAILAAARKPGRSRERAPAQGDAKAAAPGSALFVAAGALSGAIAAALPAHSWIIGAIIGISFAAIAGFIARRL